MAQLYVRDKLQLLAWGDAGYVYKVTDHIVLKHSITENDPRTKNENSVFDLLERHPTCPDIVSSFLRLPDSNFLQLLPGGTLEARLQARQTRDPETWRVVKVEGEEPRHMIARWMAELSNGVAWLESLCLAHGDIQPPNLLLDSDDHLKLADFDNTARIGEEVDVGTAPYTRLLGTEAGEDCGRFGFLGARIEQFAIGSVYYYLTRGYEPYDNEWYGKDHGPVTVDMLQRMEFPATQMDSEDDAIIRKCWHGEFGSVEELAAGLRLLDREANRAKPMAADLFRARQEECKKLVVDGLLRF
jgi:atypical protein kinase C zeta type